MADHPLHIGLFTNVDNAPYLRQQLLAGNADFEYAFLDATVLVSRNHVLSACFRAVNDQVNERLHSRNVHSEIVFALSPNNNIAESFRRFGISDESHSVLAVKVGGVPDRIENHLRGNVKGELKDFSDENLSKLHDAARLRKLYRLDPPKEGANPAQLEFEAEAVILGSMALKGS